MRNLESRLAKLESLLLPSSEPEPAHHWIMNRLICNPPAYEAAKLLAERLRIISPVSIAQDPEAKSLARDMIRTIRDTQSKRSEL
jgi:hypothetical protein